MSLYRLFRTIGRLLAALQLDDDAHPVTIALVTNIGNAFDPLVGDQFGDLFDQAGLVHLIGNFGDDDDVAILCLPLDLGAARAS